MMIKGSEKKSLSIQSLLSTNKMIYKQNLEKDEKIIQLEKMLKDYDNKVLKVYQNQLDSDK